MKNNLTVPIDEFAKKCDDLSTHLSMKEGSFQGLIQYEVKRHKLFMIARSQGVEHMRCFAYHFHGDVEDKISTASYDGKLDGYKNARLTYEKKIPTGDVEFDEFRKSVMHFDPTYHYSDDATMWRAGNAAEERIKAGVEKGGIYKTFYDYWKKLEQEVKD